MELDDLTIMAAAGGAVALAAALRFGGQTPRMIASLLMLAVAALVLPTLAHGLHLPAGEHEQALSVVCAVALLLVFAVLTKPMLKEAARTVPAEAHAREDVSPLSRAVRVLVACGVAAALVSEWLVGALEPAIEVVGLQLAWKGKAELAVSVLKRALQVAVALLPVLVLVSLFIGGVPFTLAIPPILAAIFWWG